jgi:hypothetical protein
LQFVLEHRQVAGQGLKIGVGLRIGVGHRAAFVGFCVLQTVFFYILTTSTWRARV